MNPDYHRDAVAYLQEAEREASAPDLFSMFDAGHDLEGIPA